MNPNRGHPPSSLQRLRRLAAAALGVLLLGWLARPHLIDHFRTRELLQADVLDGDALANHLSEVPAPNPTLTHFWNSGKIPHRRAVLDYLGQPGSIDSPLRTQILREATQDADLGLREKALGLFTPSSLDDLLAVLGPQIVDPDPEVRRLGLQTLRRIGDTRWTPALLDRLSDPEPSVALAADAILRRWSRLDSGLRLTNALPGHRGILPSEVSTQTQERLAQAQRFWRKWWDGQNHASAIAWPPSTTPPPRHPLPDFELFDLEGRPHRLSEFRGRTVLLNFWATWCTPCAEEMPALIQLQQSHSNDLAILGINLDTFQDGPLAHAPEKPADPAQEPAVLRRIVGTIAARHRLNYLVLLDSSATVSRRFEGNELPTQVLIDASGRLVRRFVGGRSPEAWEALLRYAALPADSAATRPN